MKNNIMLHGATNCKSSNYGDFIYGDMIYSYFKNLNFNVLFYQPSEFFVKYLNNYKKIDYFSKKDANLIVYIPGGYFGEGQNARFRDNIIQFLRFMPLGLWASRNKKDMIVLGVGAGPLKNPLMKYGVKRIINSSKLVTTRDNESYKCLKMISSNNQIFESGDLILTYKVQMKKNKSKQINDIIRDANGKKLFIIHFNHDLIALDKFVKAINMFDSYNNDYYYVVASDSILDNELNNISMFKENAKFNFYHFIYTDPYELSTLLNECSVVLTCKLHVGVVSSLLNKSVIVAACHYDKTKRFYEQIGYSDRCINLYNSSDKEIYELIEKKKSDKINIPKKEIIKAQLTWNLLKDYIMGENNEK